MVEFKRLTLRDCDQATGTVVVIDVVRAFTTAAFAFAAGAHEIVLMDSVEEAFALRQRLRAAGDHDVLLMGEVGGEPIEGFDLGNSPSALAASNLDLGGRRLVQRTSAGTRGVVKASAGADVLLAGSLVVGRATAGYLRQLAPEQVTFVITGAHGRGPLDGDEDTAGADYIEALLARSETGQSVESETGQSNQSAAGASLQTEGQGIRPLAGAGLQTAPCEGQHTKPTAVAGLQTVPCEQAGVDPAPYVQRVRGSFAGRLFGSNEYPYLAAADIDLCVDVDRFDFCLRVDHEDGLLVMRPVRV